LTIKGRLKYFASAIRTAYLLYAAIATLAGAQPGFEMAGFCTQNGGTTGGEGGNTVTATSLSQLKSAAESSSPVIIMVEGTLSGGTVNIKSNKSIIGVGSTAFLKGVGFGIKSNNIIIRNLKMTLIGNSGINGGDVISISGSAKNIWVDHCELYSEDPNKQKDIDKYDGLIDVKGKCGFITFSWNYLHDHHKCGIVGASESDIYSERKITFHHNFYENIKLRVPHYRGGTGHFFNNYVVGAHKASEIRNGACVRVEKNYYDSLHFSIYTPNDYPGKAERIDNIEVKRASRPYPENCVADIPYDYSAVLIENTADVRIIVPQNAGVGRIGKPLSFALPPSPPVPHPIGGLYDLLGKPAAKDASFSPTYTGIFIRMESGPEGEKTSQYPQRLRLVFTGPHQ
jgi:pectate lyase